jgi:hypothetical protein
MLRYYIAATAVLAGLTFVATTAEAQLLRRPTAPITVDKGSDAPKRQLEQSTLPVPAGRWGTSEPLSRPCYAGGITEPCSTPGPSVKIELPGFRVRK